MGIRVQEAQKSKEVMNRFLEENQKLVHMTVRRYYSYTINTAAYDDFFQMGMIGLYKAAIKFDPSLFHKFSTYAVFTIHGELRHYHRDFCTTILKIPRSEREKYFKFLKLKDSHPDMPDIDICRMLKYNFGKFRPVLDAMREHISLEYQLTDEGLNLEGAIADSADLEDQVIENQAGEDLIVRFGDRLNDKQKQILRLRMQDKTQQQIANVVGLHQAQVGRHLKTIKQLYIEMAV